MDRLTLKPDTATIADGWLTPCGHSEPQAASQLHGVCIFCWRNRAGEILTLLRREADEVSILREEIAINLTAQQRVSEYVTTLLSDLSATRKALAEHLRTCCDSPDDRMYHAADRTWWRREGERWVAAEEPEAKEEGAAGTVYECNACDWVGVKSETLYLAPFEDARLCPECRETTEPYDLRWFVANLLETAETAGSELAAIKLQISLLPACQYDCIGDLERRIEGAIKKD